MGMRALRRDWTRLGNAPCARHGTSAPAFKGNVRWRSDWFIACYAQTTPMTNVATSGQPILDLRWAQVIYPAGIIATALKVCPQSYLRFAFDTCVSDQQDRAVWCSYTHGTLNSERLLRRAEVWVVSDGASVVPSMPRADRVQNQLVLWALWPGHRTVVLVPHVGGFISQRTTGDAGQCHSLSLCHRGNRSHLHTQAWIRKEVKLWYQQLNHYRVVTVY